MDKSLRNTLRNAVTQCRRLLEEAIAETLQGQFGIYINKKETLVIEKPEAMQHLSAEDRQYRAQILVHLEHIEAGGFKTNEAFEQLVREAAFTHLNRLCAYKMMENRGLIREAVSRGLKSQGFIFYLADHPEKEKLWSGGQQDLAYRHFLEWLAGTLSQEIGVLFSPQDPANRLFPSQRVLDQVLALLNDDELKAVWAEDETIGWIYQYFTPKELRDRARKESQAPRNSYELAFRNQFYTPRYVVEFLTDNTLGRIWYEMRKGETVLKEKCRYLVRRPYEIFLKEGEEAPQNNDANNGLSQTELVKQPVHIPHRPKKDPREIKIIDPACGSGHFLLYCFDLLETIYQEAYEDPELGPKLKQEFATLSDLQREMPRLILAHNLHGIDIDLRATQIAALTLWLRAQRSYQQLGLKNSHRPPITKSNIVCAEPMPGEKELLSEFLAGLHSETLGQLVQTVFNKMQLAGEAGSLLKIEEVIETAIRKHTGEWGGMFAVQDEERWEKAEDRVLEALHEYAQRVVNGKGLQRRLFVDDAEQGFAFIDLCRKQFDVALMNPPFGEASKPSKSYIEKVFPRTKNDVYATFVERWLGKLASGGMLGAITSRTGFFLSSFQKWREEILLQEARPTVFADLGFGVLDTAMVETAAYCLAKNC